jgi:hypothetical protein
MRGGGVRGGGEVEEDRWRRNRSRVGVGREVEEEEEGGRR